MIFTMRKCVLAAALLLATAAHAAKDELRQQRLLGVDHRHFARSLEEANDEYEFDSRMAELMHKAAVTKMSTQTMVAETVVLGNENVSFADDVLEEVVLTTDGTKSNIYSVGNDGRQLSTTKEARVHVVKVDGVVLSATKHDYETGEKIELVRLDDLGTFGSYSSNDMDEDELKKVFAGSIDSVIVDNDDLDDDDDDEDEVSETFVTTKSLRNIRTYATDNSGYNIRRNLQGGCAEYKVIRLHIRYDSVFCNDNNGQTAATQRVIKIIDSFNDSYEDMCMKVKICRITPHCSASSDPYRQVISQSSNLCKLKSNSLVENVQSHLFGGTTKYANEYPNTECDATHLFFGGDPFGTKYAASGCAYTGVLCHNFAVAVNQLGPSDAIASVVVAHELGHNLNAEHVNSGDFIMRGTVSSSYETFSPVSKQSILKLVAKRDGFSGGKCVATEVANSPPPPPPPTPNPAPPPTPSPTSTPTVGDKGGTEDDPCRGTYTSRRQCNQAPGDLCTWRDDIDAGECWQRSEMTCTDFTNESRCVLHGDQCVYGKNGEGCFDPCTDKTDRPSCNRVEHEYCTWRPELRECWFRYKMECPFYTNAKRCLGHGTFCDWNESKTECTQLTKPSTSPTACDVYVSRKLCVISPFDICAWDYTATAAGATAGDGNLGACARKDAMSCSGNIEERFCVRNDRCSWNGSSCNAK